MTSSIATTVWMVSFRLPNQVSQAEIKKYTKEAADKVAEELELLGAAVVITEDVEVEPMEEGDEVNISGQHNRKLNWDEGKG